MKSRNRGRRQMHVLIAALAVAIGMSTSVRRRDVTFFHISDQHYGAKNFDPAILRRTIDVMNALPGARYPRAEGGSVGMPRGVIMTGDLTDGGQPAQWADFFADWGLTGKEGRLRFPVYEIAGNHDGPPSTRGEDGYVRRQIISRNGTRTGIINRSANGLHYSWDWDDVHFVCLNEYAGLENDQRYPGNPTFNRKKEDYGNPAEQSLQFLAEDLASQVGKSSRPVVLAQHYGFDDFSFHPWGEKASWWTEEHALRLWEVLEGYNVIAILCGHDGSEAAVKWHGILNQHMDDAVRFGVYHITKDKLTVAKRNSATGAWEEISSQPTRVNSALPPELLEGPYLIYPNDPAKMKVLWRCSSNIACTLKWGDDQFHYEDGNVHVLPYDRANHVYQYTIGNLLPDTGVNYTLEINGKFAPGMFYTAPATGADKVKFVVVSVDPADPAVTDRIYNAVYDRIYKDPAYHSFLLHTGSFVTNEERLLDWDRQFFSREPQLRHARYVLSRLPVMGSAREPKGLAGRILPYPYQAGGWYSFDYGPVHIVVLDLGKSCVAGSPQHQWLKADLESTPNTWRVILASASGADDLQSEPGIEPLCQAYGVDLLLKGAEDKRPLAGNQGTRYVGLTTDPKAGTPHPAYVAITIEGDTLTFVETSADGESMGSFTMKDFHGGTK